MQRQIVLDTETTGIDPLDGHRIIEIGCVELVDRKFTGKHFHQYINPERPVDDGAFRVHGISSEFLLDKLLFKQIVNDLLAFIEGAELIIHNAPFDVGFLNRELSLIKWPKSLEGYCSIVDTLQLARKKHPGQRNSLDALCKRYDVDNSNRQLHGALLDAEILGHVYLAMTGGQGHLLFDDVSPNPLAEGVREASPQLQSQTPVVHADAEELARHETFLVSLVKKSQVDLWSVAKVFEV